MPQLTDTSLKPHSYYNTGGTCQALFAPASLEELAENMREIAANEWPFFVLGAGSNSLVVDEFWPGAVIIFQSMQSMTFEGSSVIVDAGVENSHFVSQCADKGLRGVEWMYRLPGQIGGTVRMNARCYGGEISQVVSKVLSVDTSGEIKEYEGSWMFRGYKDTVFMGNNEIIGRVQVDLHPADDIKAVREKMQHCESDREAKGQFDHPTCGCVFKNDYSVGVPSGMLLEAAGVKGLEHDGAVVNPHHSNFVYNKYADSRAILELTIKMREMVYEEFGVWLAYEMEILGEPPRDLELFVAQQRFAEPKESKLAPLRERFKKR